MNKQSLTINQRLIYLKIKNIKSNKRSKLPQLTILFWLIKITATTLGETAGDLLSMTLNFGYAASSFLFLTFFLGMLSLQVSSVKYIPRIYWFVILATSTLGTTLSDYADRTLNLGYARGSAILVTLLGLTLFFWKLTQNSLSVTQIANRKAEAFYWMTILISNTLGTALGDFMADDSGLGFAGGALVIACLLIIIVFLHYCTKVSGIVLFWLAFILTRPFGATFGDLLTKASNKGGFDLGTKGTSLILFSLLWILLYFETKKIKSQSI